MNAHFHTTDQIPIFILQRNISTHNRWKTKNSQKNNRTIYVHYFCFFEDKKKGINSMLEKVIKLITKNELWGLHFLLSVQSIFSNSNEKKKLIVFFFCTVQYFELFILWHEHILFIFFLTPLSTLRLKVQAN